MDFSKYLNTLSGKKIYDCIPDDDVISRQRFIFFRIFSFTGALVCIGVFLQMTMTIPASGWLPYFICSLAGVMLTNFYAVKKHENLSRAYWIMLSSAFLLLHIVAYTCGGIRTGGSFYFPVVILYAYMLLGKKPGQYFTILAIAHFVYMFIISKYTDWTSFAMFKNDAGLISQDFLTNAILAVFLIASQASYLQSGKNVVIQRLEKSKQELIQKNVTLLKTNKLMGAYTNKLEKSNKDLEKFVSIASHDLKSPLRAVAWLTSMIEEDMDNKMPEDVQSNFNLIKKRVNRMELLLDGLLDYSKSEKANGEITDLDVEEILKDYESVEAGEKKVRLINTISSLRISYEESKLRRIFSNLIDNAIRHSNKEQVEITIGAIQKQNECILFVEDNGPGIDPQYHEKIFVLFQTLSRHDEQATIGAGLAISKKIIEERKGRIWVESTPGKGSRFCFTVPPKDVLVKDKLQVA